MAACNDTADITNPDLIVRPHPPTLRPYVTRLFRPPRLPPVRIGAPSCRCRW